MNKWITLMIMSLLLIISGCSFEEPCSCKPDRNEIKEHPIEEAEPREKL